MQVRATMRTGQKGAKKLAARFGDRLLFVRYRYDAKSKKRFTTIEMVVDETDWTPRPPSLTRVKVAYGEAVLQRQVKAAGGKWNREKKVWLLPLDQVRKLGLERRISPS